jgi:4-amino-4-deoxy-L-arabinose transferase-like glycosyltransferase
VSVITRRDAPEAFEEPHRVGRGAPVGVWGPAALRRHWAILTVLLAGLAVRVVVMVAYTPFFWFTDTHGYLLAAREGVPGAARPFAYPAFLWLFEHLGFGLRAIVAVQHLLVLGVAALLYVFLVRRGVTRWIAALAAAPLALSPLLVNIEHHLLSDPVFIGLYTGAALLLVWRDRVPPLWACGLAGVLTAAATLTRQVGVVMVTLVVGYMLVRRFGWQRLAVFVVSFAVPMLLYVFWMHQTYGVYAVTTWRGKHLYARVAPIAQCEKLGPLTAQERQLCDNRPLDVRPGPEGYLWVGGEAPARKLPDRVDLAFGRKVIIHQPLDYLGMVASDVTHVFYLGQKQRRDEPCVAYWAYPGQRPGGCRTDAVGTRIWAEHPFRVNESLAKGLRQYARLDYLVGPFFLACILLVAFAALWHPRRGEWRLRLDAVFLCLLGLGATLGAIATANFSYRYTVALYCTLAPAAALALTHLVAERRRAVVGDPA